MKVEKYHSSNVVCIISIITTSSLGVHSEIYVVVTPMRKCPGKVKIEWLNG